MPQIQRNGRKYSSICAVPRGADSPHGAVQSAFSALSVGFRSSSAPIKVLTEVRAFLFSAANVNRK